MFGWTVDKMTIWKSVQKTASEIDFKVDGKELPQGEADGTGIGIKGIAKRGKELKVLVQYNGCSPQLKKQKQLRSLDIIGIFFVLVVFFL